MNMFLLPCALAVALSTAVVAEEEAAANIATLSWNEPHAITVAEDVPTLLSFSVESAGLVTLAISGQTEGHLEVGVLDQHRVAIADNPIRFSGNSVVGHGSIAIPRAGDYFIVARDRFGRNTSSVNIASVWLSFPALEVPEIEFGSPTTAKVLQPGDKHQGSLSSESNQPWYWYRMTSEKRGQLFLATRAPEGDLYIEVYREGSFIEPDSRIDKDEDGVGGNETANVRVTAGETIFFRVRTHSGRRISKDIPFTVRAAFVDL